MARKYNQGIYEVKDWSKYIGTKKPRYLSSWEAHVFEFLDRNPNVIKWGSEVVVVPYFSAAKTDDPTKLKKCRYMVDIYVEYRTKTGDRKIELLEVKPYNQTLRPVRGKKKEHTFINETFTYMNNLEKWTAAQKYAEERGWSFRIITERSIFRG